MGRKTSRKKRGPGLEALLAQGATQDLPGQAWVEAFLAGEHRAPTADPDPALLEALLDALVRRRETEKIAFLAALPAPRGVAKAARHAVHRLRTQRITVDKPRRGATRRNITPTPPPARRLESLASMFDAQGYRLVWVGQREPAGLLVHRARISWHRGLVELKSGATSRAEYREVQRTLSREATVAKLSEREACWLIHRGAERTKARGAALPEGYLRASRKLGKLEGPHPALAIDARAEELLTLYELPELEVWLPEEELLRDVALRLQKIATSPLLVDTAQRHAHLEDAIDGAIEQYFDSGRRAACHEFLLDTAHLVAAHARGKEAQRLRAAADLFKARDVAGEPFARYFLTRLFSTPEQPSLLTTQAGPAEPKLILP